MWPGPHTCLWLTLGAPSSAPFNDALSILISDFSSITCQRHFSPPWVKGSYIYAGAYPERRLLIFSLPNPNIHSSFSLPHNIEMKEAKSVCPLESIVTTAITQVIWPKLRILTVFLCLDFKATEKGKESSQGSKCSRGTSGERSPVPRRAFQGPFQPTVTLMR